MPESLIPINLIKMTGGLRPAIFFHVSQRVTIMGVLLYMDNTGWFII